MLYCKTFGAFTEKFTVLFVPFSERGFVHRGERSAAGAHPAVPRFTGERNIAVKCLGMPVGK